MGEGPTAMALALDFTGRTILVCGVHKGGMGGATCRQVAKAGGTVIALDREQAYVDEISGEVRALAPVMPTSLIRPFAVDAARASRSAWGVRAVGADRTSRTGSGCVVAVLDTGIDAEHETLAENLGEGWAAADAACTTNCGGGPFGGGVMRRADPRIGRTRLLRRGFAL